MDNGSLAIGVASILVTVASGFAITFIKLGRLDLKIDIMWNWYLSQTSDKRPGGRRHSDPPAGEDR